MHEMQIGGEIVYCCFESL